MMKVSREHLDKALMMKVSRALLNNADRAVPNMCAHTSQVLGSILANKSYQRVVYLGDGAGDFCPSKRMRPSDYVLARECYPTGGA